MATATVDVIHFARDVFSAIVTLTYDTVTLLISQIKVVNTGPDICNGTLTNRTSGKTVTGSVAANQTLTFPVPIADAYTVADATGKLSALSATLKAECRW